MKNKLSILLQNETVVSAGYYFKALFSKWETFLVLIILVLLIYFIKRSRNK